VSRCLWAPLMALAVIVVSLTLIIWGVGKKASSPEERQQTLALWFGGWPPTKTNAFLLAVFYGGLVLLSWWICASR
jgi:hypothetical protein